MVTIMNGNGTMISKTKENGHKVKLLNSSNDNNNNNNNNNSSTNNNNSNNKNNNSNQTHSTINNENEICPKYGLHSDMVAFIYREPFINKGYRCENMNVVDCIKTMFVPKCNETFNIWTHLLPFLLFAIKFGSVFTSEFSIRDPFYWPLAINAVGIMGFCVTSALAHMFCAMSLKARHTCFYTDYATISIYTVTAWEATFFYGRTLSEHNSYHFTKSIDRSMLICFVMSISSTVQCCITRHTRSPIRHALRVSSFVLPWIFAASPYLHRMYTCDSEQDCQYDAFRKFIGHALLYLAGAVFMATKYPERWFPGKFDSFGQSHQIMHLCTALGAHVQFESIKADMLGREAALREKFLEDGFVDKCIVFTVVIILGNLLVAFAFNTIVDVVWYKRKHGNMDEQMMNGGGFCEDDIKKYD